MNGDLSDAVTGTVAGCTETKF